MKTPRISASSYSNTAPLIWSFLYGTNRGSAELIMDNAPARSAELLAQGRVDAALVPVIAYQLLEDVRLVPDVCVGAKQQVRSVCLVTDGRELSEVESVGLDVSSRTSVVLTKIIFREFLGFEPEWRDAEPDIDTMLSVNDAALIIGDPALVLSEPGATVARNTGTSFVPEPTGFRTFDLGELWHQHTELGFVFAMWMTRRESVAIDLAAARDEGMANLPAIAANYSASTGLSQHEMLTYLSENISYSIDESMQNGMQLYFELAEKHSLIDRDRPLEFI